MELNNQQNTIEALKEKITELENKMIHQKKLEEDLKRTNRNLKNQLSRKQSHTVVHKQKVLFHQIKDTSAKNRKVRLLRQIIEDLFTPAIKMNGLKTNKAKDEGTKD